MNTRSLLAAIEQMIEKLPAWSEDAIIYQYEDVITCDPRSVFETMSREHETRIIYECHDLDDVFPDFGNCEDDAAWLLAQIINEQLGTDVSAAAAIMGSMRSDKKAAASRENGKKGGRPLTIHATPQFGGGYTLTTSRGIEMDNGTVYPSAEDALQAAQKIWPDGRRVRNCWRIKNT